MSRSDFKFSYRKRVRYAEIDAQAVVFNSRYLEYVDIGITEYWRSVGIKVVPGPDTPEFHVVKATVEYRKPIRVDEEIDICVRVVQAGRSSLTTAFEFHGRDEEDLRACGEIIHVHVDLETGRSQQIPAWIVELFEAFENRSLRQLESTQ